jgi:hypothetical protein
LLPEGMKFQTCPFTFVEPAKCGADGVLRS